MASSSGTAVMTLPVDTEILVTREFDAPPELVWRAWTEPSLVSQWWPGERGRMVSCEIDLRVGGTYRYAMKCGADVEDAFHGSYREIEAPSRLVYTEIFEGVPEPDVAPLNVITFEAVGERTLL